MYKNVKPIFFKAVSGIHAGTGSDLGLVDLPIQRERHSGLPKIESSGVKGCIREEFEQMDGLPKDFVKFAFGPDADDKDDKHAGSIAFTDARLLLFPVRSARGVFAYATCPYILKRLCEDFKIAGIKADTVPEVMDAQVSSDKLLISGNAVLEEYTIAAVKSDYAKKLAENIAKWLGADNDEYLLNNLIILTDDDLKDFAQNNTEIITRIKIDNEKGTVVGGALFTEELLPAETVMYSLVMTSKIFVDKELREGLEILEKAKAEKLDEGAYLLDVIEKNMPDYIQLGGDSTIGKGLCRVKVGV